MSTIQVDRIIPFQSSSVSVEGLSAPNLATTGSNTFTGDQNIQGTITASIAEGFALVGGVGNVSTLVATSSFGGGGSGDGFPYSGSAEITGSLTVSGSTSIIPALLPNTFPEGGTAQFIIPVLSGSNFTFARDVDNGLYYSPAFNNLGISSSTANTTISPGGMSLNSSTTGSTSLSTTRIVHGYGQGRQISISAYPEATFLPGMAGITDPSIIVQSGSVPVGVAFYAPIQFESSQSFTDGRVKITRPLHAQEGVIVTGSEAGVNTNISTLSTVITSGSNNSTVSAILFSNVDTSGGNVRLIGLYANPEKVNAALAGKVQPSLVGVNSSFAPYQVLELQSHGNYTDGTAGFKVPLEVTGSVTISGSAADDLIVFGNAKVSGSSNYVTIGTNNVFAINNSGGGAGVSLDFGGYLAVGTADGSEISIVNDEGQYGSPGNWTGPAIVANNPSNTYPAIIGFQNKSTWTDGRPTFLTPVDISGSVNITDVLQLAGQDPLPAGGVGQLAVSSSGDLYYHNGAGWQLK